MGVPPDAVAREVEEVYFPAFVDALRAEDPQFKRLLRHAHSRGQNQSWSPGVMALYERTMVFLAVKQYLVRKRDFELGWEHPYSKGKRQWLDAALLVGGEVAAAIEVKMWYTTAGIRRDIRKLRTLEDHVLKYVLTYWH